ncbi:hypothetical protein [Bradyrhizobium liaoningense]|uniref:hypothetical protein n=1 Tax=Bradyrhizobium liaoningense TaxID=43992 RepID=UPI001BAD787D|nr:hypothetical protein [Bradyrhizobium liaoningense]MBR0908104.1 hypothetical protein [Bradyrhizobium liaoningense]
MSGEFCDRRCDACAVEGKAAGQFRALAGNLVEVDAAVMLPMATKMLNAKSDAASRLQLH